MIKSIKKLGLRRALSFLLALVMVLALIPAGIFNISAKADGETGSSYSAGFGTSSVHVDYLASRDEGTSYTSPNGLGTVIIRTIPVYAEYKNHDSSDAVSYGWCLDHGKGLGGAIFTENSGTIGSAADPFMAYFFYKWQVENPNMSDWDKRLYFTYAQCAVWLAQANPSYSYDDAEFQSKLLAECVAALAANGIDYSPDIADIVQNYKNGNYGSITHYIYTYAGDSTFQRVLAPTWSYSGTPEIDEYKAYIKLHKLVDDSGTTSNLAGATFGVYSDSACTDLKGTIVSGDDGWAYSEAIAIPTTSATLWVKEISSGTDGVSIDSGVYSVTVNSETNNSVETAAQVMAAASGSFVNPMSATIIESVAVSKTITLTKYSADNKPLAGALYEVTKDGTPVGSYTTNSSGQIVIENITTSGYYIFEEKTAPAGYLVPDRNWVSVYVDASDTSITSYNVAMVNYEYPDIVIRKTVAGTTTPLAGAEFEVTIDNRTLGSFVTDSNGQIVITYEKYKEFLTAGNTQWTVDVYERKAPSGYLLGSDTHKQNEIIKGQALSEFTFSNAEYPKIVIEKHDAVTDALLAGAHYQVYIDGTSIGTFITDSSGKITIAYDKYKDYIDERNTTWGVTVNEVQAPDGYFLPETVSQVGQLKLGQSLLEFAYKNQPYPDVVVLKVDADTNEPLAGAVFTLKGVTNQNSFTATSDSNGIARFKNVPEGTYKLIESTSPAGYLPNDDEKTVVVKANGETELNFTFENVKKPGLYVYKYDELTAQPLPNTEFSIREKDGTYTYEGLTNSSGYIFLENLDEGWYTITEMAPPPGYLASETSSRDVWLDGGKIVTVKFDNLKCPTLTVIKTDSVTGEALAGVEFKVEYSADNTFSTGGVEDLGKYKTDADGKISLVTTGESKYLGTGWYRISEVASPAGYISVLPEPQIIHLAGGEDKTIYFENIPQSIITIHKYDNDTHIAVAGATFEIRYLSGTTGGTGTLIKTVVTGEDGTVTITGLEPGTYTVEETIAPAGYELSNPSIQTAIIAADDQYHVEFIFGNPAKGHLVILKLDSVTKQPLKGAQFNVTYADGSVIGSSNGIYTTDASGLITIEDYLDIGAAVIVQEMVAPDGYILDTAAQTVKIKENTTHTLTFYNTPKGGLIIEKRDSVTKEPLAGAQFEVKTSSGEYVGQSGGTISSNGIYTTNANGQILITDLMPDTYVVTEITAPDGYNLDAPAQTVKINENDTQTLTFYDSPKSGIQIVKIDKDTKQPIKGAEFTIYLMNGEVVGTYTTDENGLIILDGFDPGWYKAVETKAPAGYLLDDTPKDFEITSNQFLKLVFENVKLPGLQILKVDKSDNSPIPGVEFRVSKMNGEVIGVYTTDSNGLIYLSELTAGYYTVEETEAAAGYIIDNTIHTVEVISGEVTLLTVKNVQSAGILIQKIDSMSGAAIPGVRFMLSDANRSPIGVYTTDDKGRIWISEEENLPRKFPN